MGWVSVDGREGEFIRSFGEMLVRFSVGLSPRQEAWQRRLQADPGELELIERELAGEFSRDAGLIVADWFRT